MRNRSVQPPRHANDHDVGDIRPKPTISYALPTTMPARGHAYDAQQEFAYSQLSEDPARDEWGADSFGKHTTTKSNIYTYVGGNPVSYVDPDGLCRRGDKPMEGNPGVCVRDDRVDPVKCMTGECAAGLTPTPLDLRPASETNKVQCKLECQMMTALPVAACNAALGGNIITGLAVGGPAKAGFCAFVCK